MHLRVIISVKSVQRIYLNIFAGVWRGPKELQSCAGQNPDKSIQMLGQILFHVLKAVTHPHVSYGLRGASSSSEPVPATHVGAAIAGA